MRLGLNIGYWSAGNGAANLALVRQAERLGFSVVWAAETYGSDVPTVLAWVAAQTRRIDIGSAVMQIPARTPATTAMTAATLDQLSDGRLRLGLGVSGPQVSEGWHGVPFDHPIGRTREYVDIVRKALEHKKLSYAGRHYQLPLPGRDGKVLALTVDRVRKEIPIYLAALGPKNLELTGECADGWLSVFFAPEYSPASLAHIRAGQKRAGRTGVPFDVVTMVPMVVGDDWRTCADEVRGYTALYLGGMGSRQRNFYHDLAARMGFAKAAENVRDKFLDRDISGALAALPLDFLDATSLLGPPDRIADRMQALADAGVTTLTVLPMRVTGQRPHDLLRTAAEALDRAGVGD